jgi:hypothetical protein
VGNSHPGAHHFGNQEYKTKVEAGSNRYYNLQDATQDLSRGLITFCFTMPFVLKKQKFFLKTFWENKQKKM